MKILTLYRGFNLERFRSVYMSLGNMKTVEDLVWSQDDIKTAITIMIHFCNS